MSGFAGIVNLDGRPVDRELLARMTTSLEFRGPDATSVWVEGRVGFGHTLLRTTDEAAHEHQPFTFDGSAWIVGDVRVDARRELVASLAEQGRQASLAQPDIELVLHAYHVWGEDCVQHLLGDFAFAIWDPRKRHLLCARDQMGVKPFYYAHIDQTLVFSNSLDCVRHHTLVADDLNDLAVADFLMFGHNNDPCSTIYRNIHRLRPSHRFVLCSACRREYCYWKLPEMPPLYLRDERHYIDTFRELLDHAVRDRLRVDRVGILMSGGLDSPTLAVTARNLMASSGRARSSVHAITSVYDRLITDSERYYATLVAAFLGIPIHFDIRDDEISLVNWQSVKTQTPEPVANPMAVAASQAFHKSVGKFGRVIFYGEGPDDALKYEWWSYLKYMLNNKHWPRLLVDIALHAASHRRIPLISSLPAIIRERRTPSGFLPTFPQWLDPDFVTHHNLIERWHHSIAQSEHGSSWRPKSYASLTSPLWQTLFENCDRDAFFGQLEYRHPFLDIRLLSFLLRIPTIPWCRRKHVIRRALRGKLPAEILERDKTRVGGNADFERMLSIGMPPRRELQFARKYIVPDRVPTPRNALELRSTLRPHGLGYWLSNRRQVAAIR